MPRSPHEIKSSPARAFTVPVIATGLVVLATVAVVAITPRATMERSGVPIDRVVAARHLLFSDTTEGALVVIDERTRLPIEVYGVGEGAFVRATIRALIMHRANPAASREEPFHLLLDVTGRLLLLDPTSTRVINLNAFGDVGQLSFSPLLTAQPDVVATVPPPVTLATTSLED